MFNHAIVRKPCPEMIHGLSEASLGIPDYKLALAQHSKYLEALSLCGLEVHELDPDSRFPDSTFVEDVALCTPEIAIVTNPGASSRNGERIEIKEVLQTYYNRVASIEAPATLDAGDVMMTGRHFFIGISERTNQTGADQLIAILENEFLLVGGEFRDHPSFKKFHRIKVDPDEIYAANSLWINDTVLVPAGFPKTSKKIENAGYEIITLDMSEFQKLDGGLSCLSLRF